MKKEVLGRWGKSSSPEEEHHTATKRFKIDKIIKCSFSLDVPKHSHANNGVDESNEEKQGTDIEEGGQGNYEGEQELSDAFGGLQKVALHKRYIRFLGSTKRIRDTVYTCVTQLLCKRQICTRKIKSQKKHQNEKFADKNKFQIRVMIV